MTSPDGVNWTIQTSAADNGWLSVCWSPELHLFAVVSYSGSGNRAMIISNDPHSQYLTTLRGDERYYTQAQVDVLLGDNVPIGQQAFFDLESPPEGWLVRDGSLASKDEYPELFAAIGLRYRTSDDITNDLADGNPYFRVGRAEEADAFYRAWGNGNGLYPDRDLGSWQEDELRSHSHTYNSPGGGSYSQSSRVVHSNGSGYSNKITSLTGGLETRPQNIALLSCIKAYHPQAPQ